jgi:ATP-binding cassette subfamily C protein CydC
LSTLLRDLGPVLRLFLSERRRALITGALLAAVTGFAGIALVGLSGWFISATAIAGWSLATALSFDVLVPSAGIRLLALARAASRYGERLQTHDATLYVLAALRERLFRGWAEPGAARDLLLRPSKLLFRLTVDIDALDSLYLRVLVPATVAASTAIVTALVLGCIYPLLGLCIGLGTLLAGFGIAITGALSAARPARRRAHAMEALRSRTIDLVAGQTDLLMTGRLAAGIKGIVDADHRLAQADDALNRIDTRVSLGFGLVTAGLLSSTVLAVASLAEAGTIGAPVAALALLIASAAVEPFAGLRRGAVELNRFIMSARRVGPRINYADPHADPGSPHGALAVQLDGVCVSHAGSQNMALSQISLHVCRGEHIAIIGASGAGKSTLLTIMTADMKPSAGEAICLPGTLMTQRTELFQDSLRDNLRLAAPTADDDRLQEALFAAGLGNHVASLAEGLFTCLGEGGTGLSGGQARRLALARLFLRDTPLWLLDEPTEGLDGVTARDVMQRLVTRAMGRCIVVATHIRREAQIADRLVILDRGLIVGSHCRGTPEYEAALADLRPD